jgi:hypothetical protein
MLVKCERLAESAGLATAPVLSSVGRENARQALRPGGRLLPVLPPLELVGYRGGEQGAGDAEQDPGGGVGQPVGSEVGAGEPHQYGERHRGRAPPGAAPPRGHQGDDGREDGD